MTTQFLLATVTLDLVLDMASSAVNGVRTEPKWLFPRLFEKGASQCCRTCRRCPHSKLHGALRAMTDGPDVVSSASVLLLPRASLCSRTCGSSLTCRLRGPCVGDENIPIAFPSNSPAPDCPPRWSLASAVPELSRVHRARCFTRSLQKFGRAYLSSISDY